MTTASGLYANHMITPIYFLNLRNTNLSLFSTNASAPGATVVLQE